MLHPIVAQLEPSPEQIPAITARGDVVVTAGAGAGKTRTLVARYLARLAEGMPLRAIVAITFTRKAAREMRNRLREQMRAYLEQPDLSPAERELWSAHLTGLDAARVGTIHSLCADLLRTHPAEAGLDPRFDMLDETQSRLLQQQAVRDTLVRAANDPALAGLFAWPGEQALAETVAGLLNQRLEVGPLLATLPLDDILTYWQQELSARQAQARAELTARPDWAAASVELRVQVADKADDKLELLRQQALATVADSDSGFVGLGDLKRINSVGSQKNWPGGKGQLEAVRQALQTLVKLWQAQAELLTAHLNPLDEQLAAVLPGLGTLFSQADQRYRRLKQTRHALDFDDLESRALALLQEHPPVRQRWQTEVQALLVDEFQDTNARQRDLLTCLNREPGKLFIVGDAKQSIYRFRGADVAVFRQERDRIAAGDGQHLRLPTSYRAHRPLIELLNDLFAPILGLEADPARPWLEPFAPLHHHRPAPAAGLSAPHLELHLAAGSKTDGALSQAARMLVNRLVALVEAPDNALDYGDIAILGRSGTSFGPYEDALEAAGVPFLTVSGRGFYHRPEIRDLLNALPAIADPTDDLALVGLLRSPMMGLSDAALYHLRRRDENGERPGLWAALQTLPAALTPADARQAQRAIELVSRWHGQTGRVPAADLLKQVLDESGYPAALSRAGESRSRRNVTKLLDDANRVGLVSLNELVDYLISLRDSGSREGEARAVGGGAVQLMTVHAAKGLEFPVVVIGDAGYSHRGRADLLLDPDWGVLPPFKPAAVEAAEAPDKYPVVYQLARQPEQDKEAAEEKRLLYVALTRAQEKALVSGTVTLKKDDSPGKAAGWLGELVGLDPATWAAQTVTGSTTFELITAGGVMGGCIEPGEVPLRQAAPIPAPDVPAEVKLPPLLAPLDLPAIEPATLRISRVTPPAARPRPPARLVGELVHRALAAWRFPGGEGRFEAWLAGQARAYGLPDAGQVVEALAQSLRLLTRFQQHPLYAAMNEAAIRRAEVPYQLLLDGTLHRGRLDALFQQAGRWTVVEFKSDAVRDEAERQRVLTQTDYLSQVRRYQRVVEQFTGQTPAVILCWLNVDRRIYLQTDDPAWDTPH